MFLKSSKIRIYVPIQGKYSNESSIHQNDFFEDYKEDVKIISEMQDKEVMVQSNEKYQESLQVANALKDALES